MNKIQIFSFFILLTFTSCINKQQKNKQVTDIKLPSRIKGKYLNVSYHKFVSKSMNKAVLFIHGASFPSALASEFKINGTSWEDNLNKTGYDVYALDF